MFVPPPYREPDGSWMADLIRGNPLALLVGNGPDADGPFATHLPVIPDPEASGAWSADLSGAVLLGHMNRANPHWAALESGATAVLAFTGPHAYVSPTLYEVTPAAPTWNFTSVHVRGTVERIDERASAEAALQVVQATVRAFEGRFGTGWDMSASLDYFRQILPAVGAFRFTVLGADGMFKLSQEQSAPVRERVQHSFGQRACSRHRATAALMEKLP
ncbi:FMN-binding negative transcriptional regulator [Streptomyces resistomycificus]|uniref:Transcriptional regulator n=1 Tax=Streptomyces resistomycificus TaxID=67356 RepID=A0A0L8L313_9ACTN|nr:FMN-binding negative transcriptional regulator [Streptomyces resistomycificus]KOG32623.1 transcriptional regulator [Streptomyces resistomycificus]KUN90562.1 transcriptional regulator [Streptomyces resistomycificus]